MTTTLSHLTFTAVFVAFAALLVVLAPANMVAAGGAYCTSNGQCNAPMIAGTNLDNGFCDQNQCNCYAGITGANCNCRSSHTCSGQGVCVDDSAGSCSCHEWSENGTLTGRYFGRDCGCKKDGDACNTKLAPSGHCARVRGGCAADPANNKWELAFAGDYSWSPPYAWSQGMLPSISAMPLPGRTLINTDVTTTRDLCFTRTPSVGGSFTLDTNCLSQYSPYGIVVVWAYLDDRTNAYTTVSGGGSFSLTGWYLPNSPDASDDIVSGTWSWAAYGCSGASMCHLPGSCQPCYTTRAVVLVIFQYQ